MRINEGLFLMHGYEGRYLSPSGWPRFWKSSSKFGTFSIWFYPEEFSSFLTEEGKSLIGKYSTGYGGIGEIFTPDELPNKLIEFDKLYF